MKKVLIGIGIGLVVVAGLVAVLLYRPNNQTTSESISKSPASSRDTTSQPDEIIDAPVKAEGRYTEYNETLVAADGYNETILFFHAPWCPECRAFEQVIESEPIPNGVQILKVDYDSSTELKTKYGVTLQTTFVKVDPSGEQVSAWVGYGKDKSVAIILENT